MHVLHKLIGILTYISSYKYKVTTNNYMIFNLIEYIVYLDALLLVEKTVCIYTNAIYLVLWLFSIILRINMYLDNVAYNMM